MKGEDLNLLNTEDNKNNNNNNNNTFKADQVNNKDINNYMNDMNEANIHLIPKQITSNNANIVIPNKSNDIKAVNEQNNSINNLMNSLNESEIGIKTNSKRTIGLNGSFHSNKSLNNSINCTNNDKFSLEEIKPDIYYSISLSTFKVMNIYPFKTGSFYSTLFFLIFSTLGSGIIILPITMKSLGIIPATFLFISCALTSYFTLSQLIFEAYETNMYYFSNLVEYKYGKNILVVVEICFHVGNLLGVVVFNKVSKKLLLINL